MKIAILGAGLAGLELGRKLQGLQQDFVILEKEPKIGGLCRTNKTGNYRWDFGVHAMYSRNKEIMDYFDSLPIDYEHINRNVKIFHTGRNRKRYIIDYPFEIGIKDLPFNDKLECVWHYVSAGLKGVKNRSNLEEWINNHLGMGIAKHFMIPYNNKIWNCKLSEISDQLVSSKIEPATVIDFLLAAFGRKTIGRAYQAKFIYPKHGVQELIDYTAKDVKAHMRVNFNINELVKHKNSWTIISDSGVRIEADVVISTVPLVELLYKINVGGLKKKYDVFKWNNTFFIMVALKQKYEFKLIKDCQWVFFKEDEIFYRITLMHNFSSEFSPILVAEITQKGDVSNKNSEEIQNLVIKDLIRKGVLGSINQIAQTDIKLVEYTYPIPTVGLEDIKFKVGNTLRKHNMFLLGRNGNWDYINMDGVILKVGEFIKENKHLLTAAGVEVIG